MKLKSNLQAKILLLVLSSVLLIFLFIGLFIGVRNRDFAVDKAHEYTQLMADKYAQSVSALLKPHTGFVKAMADAQGIDHGRLTREADSLSKLILNNQLANNAQYQSVWFLWKENYYVESTSTNEGWVLIEANRKETQPQTYTQIPQFQEKFAPFILGSGINMGEPFYVDDKYYAQITAPVTQNGQVKGYAGITLDLSFFEDFIADAYIFEGGFITVLTHTGMFIAHANEGFIGKTFSQNFPDEAKRWPVEEKIRAGQQFEIKTNLGRKSYYSYFIPVKIGSNDQPWSVEVTVPMHKILESSNETIRSSVIVAFFGMLLMIFVIWWISRRVSKPVKKVTGIMQFLSKGNIDNIDKLDIRSGDELEEMGKSVNYLIDGLKKTEMFAIEIGKGNLDLDYTLLGENDQIGRALLDMRDNLKENRVEEKKRKEEEEKRNWSTHGIAKFGDILRQDSANMKTLGYNIMSNLIEYLDVNQGALFVLNEDDDIKQFELITAIAYGRDKLIKQTINIGEGLVGRCAFEKKTVYITDVPDDYINITSGLGTANPKAVLLVPCIINDEVYSVIELASFSEFLPHEIEFVEKLGESIASTISSVKISEKTNRLLSESQKQGEELAAQEEELRQNLEEMEATQEDLQRQMKTNTEMREKMKKQNALLDSLLRNLPDYIYFKDEESRFIRISDSMLKLFGANSVEDIIGKSDFDFQTKENAEKYYRDEKEIMENLSGFTNKIQKEQMPDGTVIWNSVTKMPLIDENDKVIGTFGISKDITQTKLTEQELNEKQVELKGVNDAIKTSTYMVEYNTKGIITDVNDAVLELFNLKKEKLIGTHHKEGIDWSKSKKTYDKFWADLLEGKPRREHSLLIINNKKVWMSETYTPIKDAAGKVYKIIKIAFDITDFVNNKQ